MKHHILFFLLLPLSISAKILIITHSYNRPDFIEVHAKTFKAFLQDEYEYVVFNDAPNRDMQHQIEAMCQNLHIRCFRVPEYLHIGKNHPSERHMAGIKFALEEVGFKHEGIVTLIDSDLFLIKPFSIEKYLEGYDLAGELQGRGTQEKQVRYLSPILVFMNMQTLPNRHTISFEGNQVEGFGCDVGGHTHYYFKNNPTVKTLHFGSFHIGTLKVVSDCKCCNNLTCSQCIQRLTDNRVDARLIKFIHSLPDFNIEFALDYHFLHYRGGSNWDYKSVEYHKKKSKAFNDLLADILLIHE